MLEFRFICPCTPVGFSSVFAGGARRGLPVPTLCYRWLQQGPRCGGDTPSGVCSYALNLNESGDQLASSSLTIASASTASSFANIRPDWAASMMR